MYPQLHRRQFLSATAAAAVCTMLPRFNTKAAQFRGKIRKAKIVGQVTEAVLKPLKEAGFDGVETTHICPEEEAAKGKAVAEQLGMRVHSVLRGWMDFNSEDPKRVENSLDAVRKSLRAAKGYGADAVLVVPCRVGNIPMPQPWEFQINFDPKTGHVSRVVEGDNSKYEAYITAQNKATDTSRAAVEKLIPLAEELKVIIALENVWNNLWVKPDLYQNFIASFKHPWVKSYFDIGNHVKYAPPQDWVKALGPLIAKLHVKDFKLNPDGHGGKFVHPRDGSIDWPAVRKALDEAGYNGWATIEDDGLPLREFARRFDLIESGQ
ncbi:MAG TPA: sugar phosphate isomerase/epimerase family protein [Candidatus Saccharimonadales bacterium]|nr:sugar phosphate isomerase/epimerase family protein [Candidatus Saccharimonadales bacterium]